MNNNLTRREFIKTTSALSISAAMFLSGCGGGGGSGSSSPTPAPNITNPNTSKDKALVYLMLNGGNDSFNMLVPTSNNEYNKYQTSRSNLAINKNDLLPLNFTSNDGKTFGLHPSMPKVRALFNSLDPNKNLSFIANIGTLVQKTTKAQFQANSIDLPLGLMSHSDQRKHWQTQSSNKRTNIGIFGKYADEFQKNKDENQISMNISLGGTNICQNGVNSTEYSISESGSQGLIVSETSTPLNDALKNSFESIITNSYADEFEDTYMNTIKNAQSHHETFKEKIDLVNINASTFEDYSTKVTHTNSSNGNEQTKYSSLDKKIGEQFKMIAKSIKASDSLGMKKQTFYVDYYGWDHHDEVLNNHARMLNVIDDALGDFYEALIELGIEDKVVTLVGSDFGRSLTSNGNGTDHAWGGNSLIMGKDVKGGEIFGEYPDLELNSNLDIGGGVLIPTTSTDELFAELSYWFGLEKDSIDKNLPNLKNFYSYTSIPKPIGIFS